jgi:hypothetical protein
MRKLTLAALAFACMNSTIVAAADRCVIPADVVPLCTVLSDAAKYDDKEITVRGLYRMVLHGSILMAPACEHTLVNMRQAADYKANKHASATIRSLTKTDQFNSVDVVLRGTFRVAHKGECFGQNCLSYEIEDHELICAAAPGRLDTSSRNSGGHEVEHGEGTR